METQLPWRISAGNLKCILRYGWLRRRLRCERCRRVGVERGVGIQTARGQHEVLTDRKRRALKGDVMQHRITWNEGQIGETFQ